MDGLGFLIPLGAMGLSTAFFMFFGITGLVFLSTHITLKCIEKFKGLVAEKEYYRATAYVIIPCVFYGAVVCLIFIGSVAMVSAMLWGS